MTQFTLALVIAHRPGVGADRLPLAPKSQLHITQRSTKQKYNFTDSKLQKTIPDVKFHIKYHFLAGVLCIQLTNRNVMSTLPTQTCKSGSDKHNI